MAKFRVKPGRTFGALNEFSPGSVVELTEEEAKGFLDKLIPLGKAKPAPVELKNDLKVSVPDELKLLSDSEDDFVFDDEEIVEDAGEEKLKRPAARKKK